MQPQLAAVRQMRMRASGIAAALGAMVTLAVAACTSAPTPSPGATAMVRTGPLPRVSGGGIRALWEEAEYSPDMTVTDGLVVGAAYERPRVMVVPGGNVLVVEAGQDVADSVAQDFAVTEYIAVDLATGRQLWTAPVVATGGGTPPVAVSGNLLLAGNADGSVTAKALTTGAVVWHDPWLEECGAAPAPRYAASDVGIAADGPLVAVSFSCSPFTPAAVVQRLDAATGRPLWSWKTRVAAMDGGLTMTLAGAARDGGVILVTYAIVPASAEQRFAAALPHAYQWPARIGPVGPQGGVLALDAADGHPGGPNSAASGRYSRWPTVRSARRCCSARSAGTTRPAPRRCPSW